MRETATVSAKTQTCVSCRRTILAPHDSVGSPLCPACAGHGVSAASTVAGIMPLDPAFTSANVEWKLGEVVLGLYEVHALLGQGGMGRVYRVRHRGWNRILAVKVPLALAVTNLDGVLRFEQECENWSNLGLHPYVTTCYFVRRFGGVPLVFAECVEGGSLRQWIQAETLYRHDGTSVLARMLRVGVQTALGLHHAHKQGLVHQDVKPANVLMTTAGVAKVADFGLARAWRSAAAAADDASEGFVTCAGMTPAYCSPEQASGQRLSGSSDMWSWGLSVLEMFTGGITWRRGTDASEALAQFLEGENAQRAAGGDFKAPIPPMPQALGRLLAQCFERRPESRPGDMSEIANAVAEICAGATGVSLGDSAFLHENEASEYAELASLNNRAVSMIELGRLREAVGLLDTIKASTQDSVTPAVERVVQDASYNLNLLKIRWWSLGSLNALEKDVANHGGRARKAFLDGMLRLDTGELHEAIELLGQALIEPEQEFLADALNARAIGLLLVGETAPAILSFEAALAEAPDRMDFVRNLALAYYYDGQREKAGRLFDGLSETTVFDSEDAIRYATVLAARGLCVRAYEYIGKALSLPDRTTEVLLTAAELLEGTQTFLPSVVKVSPPGVEAGGVAKTLVNEVLAHEPYNLRARIDGETWPKRYGLILGAVIRDNARTMVDSESPARIGGCLASSYRALTKRFRWGDISERQRRTPLLVFSGMPALFAAFVCALGLTGSVSPGSLLLAATVFFAAAFFTLGRPPSNDLLREVLFLFPAASLPVLGVFVLAGEGMRQENQTAFLLALPSILVVFTVWQLALQRLTSFARAYPQCSSLRVVIKSLTPRRERGETRRAAVKDMRDRVRAFRWQLAANGEILSARFVAGFRGWFIYLVPQALVTLALLAMYGIREGAGVFLPFLLLPLTLAALSPRLMFFVNSPASVCAGILGGSAILEAAGVTDSRSYSNLVSMQPLPLGFCLAMGGLLFFLNWLALRRCPEFVPEWHVCNPNPWDVRQVVDPLGIRRFATPWQLSRLEPAEHAHQDALGSEQ